MDDFGSMSPGEWEAIEMACASAEAIHTTTKKQPTSPTPNSVHANRPFAPNPIQQNQTPPPPKNNYNKTNSPSTTPKPTQHTQIKPGSRPTQPRPLPQVYRQQQTAFSFSSSGQEETQGTHFRKLSNRFGSKDGGEASPAPSYTPLVDIKPPMPAANQRQAPSQLLPQSSTSQSRLPQQPPKSPQQPPKSPQPSKPQYPPIFSYGYPIEQPKGPMTPSRKWNERFSVLCVKGGDRIPVEFQLISKTHFCVIADAETPGFQPKKKPTTSRGRGRGGMMSKRGGSSSSSSPASARGKDTRYSTLIAT